jgi:GNAT superfamily N-acetyltransferase
VTTIRRASIADGTGLAELRSAWHSERYPDDEQSYIDFVEQFATWWSQVQESHQAVVATDGGQLVGMGFLALVARVPEPGNIARRHGDVQSVFVREQFRNAGIGTAIVRSLIGMARESGCDKVTVHSGTRALPLYEREGFHHFDRLLVLDLH